MSKYSEDVFRKAEDTLRLRRKTAEKELKLREAEIDLKAPEIAKLRRELESTGLELFSILKSGENVGERIESLKSKNLKLQEEMAVLLEAFTGDRDYLKAKYTCPLCGDTGFKDGRRCACFDNLLSKYSSEQITVDCGIKLHDFSEFRLDVYDTGIRDKMEKLFLNCKAYAKDFSPSGASILFIGKTGLGKTFLSSCIAKTVAEKGCSVLFGSVSVFLRKVENEHFGREEGDTLSILENCDFLILDDLGSEFRSPFYESSIYEIINSRMNSGKPTLISTNLSGAELNRTYNERIVSRLTGHYVPMIFLGSDIRQIIRSF